MTDFGWLYEDLTLLTEDEYKTSPFPWGGSTTLVKWKGSDAKRLELLAQVKAAFASCPWVGHDGPWPEAVSQLYVKMLSKFYSASAVRLLAAAHGVDVVGVSDDTGGIDEIVSRCVVARAPLSSPQYLAAFAMQVRQVVAGKVPGGARFVATDASANPFQTSAEDTVTAPQQTMDELRASNRQLQEALANAGSQGRDTSDPFGPASMKQLMAMAAAMATQMSLPRLEATTTPSKVKVGWAKVLVDTKACLVADEVPPVLKLSRANRERLKREATTAADTQRVLLGGIGGASLLLPASNTDRTTKSSAKDDPVFSGLSGFFRLFSIMASSSEEEFPRAKMADFFSVWTELWDSPRGSRAQKMKAAVTFYEKYAEELGRGTWRLKFDADSRFLLEALDGPSPGLCSGCGGSGEHTGHVAKQRTPSDRPSGGKRGRDGPSGRGAYVQGPPSLCMSMLDQKETCSRTDCRFSHGPCPSCGGGCASAAKCAAWDSKVMADKYGALIRTIKSGGRSGAKRRN